MIQKIRVTIRKSLLLRKFVAYVLAPSGLFDNYFKKYPIDEGWKQRNQIVMACPDNIKLQRLTDAGKIKNGKQYMHNGLRINLGSYYGPEVTRLLIDNKGVHEPQEEFVFMEVLKALPRGATMIEMGAFWGFYSMWFQKEVEGAVNYLVEPDAFNIISGKKNFKLNKLKGQFSQYYISDKTTHREGEVPTICVDDFMLQNNISFVDILHSDIQGYEFLMLQGAIKTIVQNQVGYVFISTHSNEVHQECLSFLKKHGFIIVSEADLDVTFSLDGLIVAKSPNYNYGPDSVTISKRN